MHPSLAPFLFSFVFHPSDDVIIQHFLNKKLVGAPLTKNPIEELNVYLFDPEDLPISIERNGKRWMYFFVYMTEENAQRSTPKGYWKLVRSDKPILDPNTFGAIGLKNSFVYYTRELGPNRRYKTNWTMEEFRATNVENLKDPKMKNLVLCKIETVIREACETRSKKRKRGSCAHKREEKKGDVNGKAESTGEENDHM